jgi:hypothetical protein
VASFIPQKIAQVVLALVIGFFLYMAFFGGFGFEGILGKSGDTFISSVKNSVSIGAEETLASTPTISQEHSNQISSLEQTIRHMLIENPDKKECFMQFDEFSDLGEDSTWLDFKYEDGSTQLLVHGGKSGKQVVESISFENMRPCVIAGESGSNTVADNFYDKFIDGKEDVVGDYFYGTPRISISYEYDDGNLFTSCANGNAIRVAEFGNGPPVNNWCNNFESNGWLFKTKGEGDSASHTNICFFPTNYVNNANKNGIANEWFSENELTQIVQEKNLGC